MLLKSSEGNVALCFVSNPYFKFMIPLFGQACVGNNSFALMMIGPIFLGWTNAACLYRIMAVYSYICSCEVAFEMLFPV